MRSIYIMLGRRCTQKTKTGRKCSRTCQSRSRKCWQHQRQQSGGVFTLVQMVTSVINDLKQNGIIPEGYRFNIYPDDLGDIIVVSRGDSDEEHKNWRAPERMPLPKITIKIRFKKGIIGYRFRSGKRINILEDVSRYSHPIPNKIFLNTELSKIFQRLKDWDDQSSCCPYRTKIVKAHGSMLPGSFQIPNGVNIITVVSVGDTCPFNRSLDDEFERFYKGGNFLFQDQDQSRSLSENGQNFLDFLKSRYRREFRITNHVSTGHASSAHASSAHASSAHASSAHEQTSGQMNNLFLSFVGGLCQNTEIACNIDCYYPKTSGRRGRDLHRCNPQLSNRQRIEEISLKNLILQEGRGTYIIVACRAIPEVPGIPLPVMAEYTREWRKISALWDEV